jgi:probable phosphoglycerate mutase
MPSRNAVSAASRGEISGEHAPHWLKDASVPGAEPYDAFIVRALAGINEALAHPGAVLIVAHGGVYWAVQIHADLDKAGNIRSCMPVLHRPPTSKTTRRTATSID